MSGLEQQVVATVSLVSFNEIARKSSDQKTPQNIYRSIYRGRLVDRDEWPENGAQNGLAQPWQALFQDLEGSADNIAGIDIDPANTSYETQASKRALDDLGILYTEQDNGRLLVKGDIDLSDRNLEHLPDLRMVIVTGYFNCSYNRLTDLEGSPESVGDFYCCYNKLATLSGAPKYISREFYYHYNPVSETPAQKQELA